MSTESEIKTLRETLSHGCRERRGRVQHQRHMVGCSETRMPAAAAASASMPSDHRGRLSSVDDEELLALAEKALTEIKIAQGLSDRHASVLAALRIRLKGSAGKSLDEMLEAAGDLRPDSLEEKLAETERRRKPSLDDLLKKEQKPKGDWPT